MINQALRLFQINKYKFHARVAWLVSRVWSAFVVRMLCCECVLCCVVVLCCGGVVLCVVLCCVACVVVCVWCVWC
jgi:hypothetical protein